GAVTDDLLTGTGSGLPAEELKFAFGALTEVTNPNQASWSVGTQTPTGPAGPNPSTLAPFGTTFPLGNYFQVTSTQPQTVSQIVAVPNPGTGTLALFGIDANTGALVYAFQKAGTDPSNYGSTPWQSMGGFARQIAVAANQAGPLELFAIGGNNNVFVNTESAGAFTFAGWQALPAQGMQQIAVAQDANGQVQVVGLEAGSGAVAASQQTGPHTFSSLG